MKYGLNFVLFLMMLGGIGTTQTPEETPKKWPHPVPARIQDSSNKDLFITLLGDVDTPLADGIYDPMKDEVTLKDGSVKRNYYRDTLGIKHYQPLDKSRFPLPPSGWCSWYYYYQEISETEAKRNAQWIAANLRDYGAQYVQIDDGWQGEGHGRTRDWTTVDKRFSGGMDRLAAYVKSLGLVPGIWLAPHGQTNEAVVRDHPAVFLLKPDGTTASDTWEGKWLVDPSTPEAHRYLSDLFTKLTNWGYEYFKIDGQPIVVEEYRTKKPFMKNPSDDTEALYRKTIETIRSAIGPDRYLLGCWGTPLEGIGILNGSRTGGDVVLGWDGFREALRATMWNYFLHNIAWYADPDVMLVRAPLTLDQARAWATLQGLTGEALLTSDRMMDLSEARVEILRRVFPAVDIRPLDLFSSERNKRIWDLKVHHLGRSYDVVGVFNYSEAESEKIHLSWKDLALPGETPIHVFDFWNKEYLGAWEKGMTVEVSPTSVRVLALVPSGNHPQLISTSRHITQGWVDLVALKYDERANSYTGRSRVVRKDSYELRFAFPRGKNLAVKAATARGSSGNLPVKIGNHQGWAAVEFTSPQNGQVSWEVIFEPADFYDYPTQEPANLRIERVGIDGANLRWDAQYYLNVGYQVYLNGELLGFTPTTAFPLRGLAPDATYSAEVKTVWENGKTSSKAAALKFTVAALLPPALPLTELEPLRIIGQRGAGFTRATALQPLRLGGAPYETGIGLRADAEVEYNVMGLFQTFSALAGVDEGAPGEGGNVELFVLGDGKELWRSGPMKKSDAPQPLRIDMTRVQRLLLRVTGSGAEARELAAWADAKLGREAAPAGK